MAKTILIIDDRVDNRDFLTYGLEDMGYKTIAVTNGKDGLKALKKHKIDLIILDYMMPNMSGNDVLRMIRKEKKFDSVKIILLSSAHIGIEELHELKKMGLQLALSKPITMKELKVGLKKVLK